MRYCPTFTKLDFADQADYYWSRRKVMALAVLNHYRAIFQSDRWGSFSSNGHAEHFATPGEVNSLAVSADQRLSADLVILMFL